MSGHKKEEAKESLYKALGRRVVWEGNLNTLLPLSTPSVLDWDSPSLVLKFHRGREGSPKAWSTSCFSRSPGGPLADSFCADRKVQPPYPKPWLCCGQHDSRRALCQDPPRECFSSRRYFYHGTGGMRRPHFSSFMSSPSSLFLLCFFILCKRQ